jgi:pseudouridine synthase
LLLWTDDGQLAQALLRPARKVWKQYQATLDRPLTPEQRRRFADGSIELDGRPCLPCRIRQGEPADGRHWVVALHEGRKRQIRRMFGALGLRVGALRRTAFGPIVLDRAATGRFRRLTRQEEAALRAAAGIPPR